MRDLLRRTSSDHPTTDDGDGRDRRGDEGASGQSRDARRARHREETGVHDREPLAGRGVGEHDRSVHAFLARRDREPTVDLHGEACVVTGQASEPHV
jgi:hypothetical protein